MNRRWAEALLANAGRVEIRHLPSARSLLVDDIDALLDSAGRLFADGGNVFTTLNRPAPGISAGSRRALADADIETVVLLPFDFDPVRPAGVASTAGELAAALDARDRFVRDMASRGWPDPARGMSGNGAHAVYRVFVRNTPGTREAMRTIYAGLRHRYSDEMVEFDSTVRNPARVWRAYGTVNRKGVCTADRPHRLAEVTVPADWRRVPEREIDRLANDLARMPAPAPHQAAEPVRLAGRGDFSSLDVVRWFDAHGHFIGHVGGNVFEVRCPWEAEHSSSSPRDTIVFAADGGWPGFHCHHAHCSGRGIRHVLAIWPDADLYCARAWRAA